MVHRNAWFGMAELFGNRTPVTGDARDFSNQRSMASRSYEWPSAATTGSTMGMHVMGQ